MNLLQEDRAKALANSYVLGVMPRRTRQRFSRALKNQPQLRNEVLKAHAAMQRLSASVPDVMPSPGVWNAIAQDLDSPVQQKRSRPWSLILFAILVGIAIGFAAAHAGRL